jgi:hypothetical protein
VANSKFARTYIDYSNEKSTIDMNIEEMTAGNFATLLTEVATLGSAIDNLSDGSLVKSNLMQDSSNFSATPPASEAAQRERKWLVRFQDTVNGRYGQLQIPVAATRGGTNNLLLLPNTDKADFTQTEWTAFISAVEATVRSVDGNVINVLEAFLVGRNL